MNIWFLISDSQFHGLGSPQLSPQFLFINFELMLTKSCVSQADCVSHAVRHKVSSFSRLCLKRARRSKYCVSLEDAMKVPWSPGRFIGSVPPCPCLLSPAPLSFHSFSIGSQRKSYPYLIWSLSSLTPLPISRCRGQIKGKRVGFHLKPCSGHAPKNTCLHPRGILGNRSVYTLLHTYNAFCF